MYIENVEKSLGFEVISNMSQLRRTLQDVVTSSRFYNVGTGYLQGVYSTLLKRTTEVKLWTESLQCIAAYGY